MTAHDFTYELSDVSGGKPGAKLEIAYSSPSAEDGSLTLHLANSVPAQPREALLKEYGQLSGVLGFKPQIDAHNSRIRIPMGDKSPEALAMFILGDLEAREFIKGGESKHFIEAILARQEPLPEKSRDASMEAALETARGSAIAGLAGGQYAPLAEHNPASENAAAKAAPVKPIRLA